MPHSLSGNLADARQLRLPLNSSWWAANLTCLEVHEICTGPLFTLWFGFFKLLWCCVFTVQNLIFLYTMELRDATGRILRDLILEDVIKILSLLSEGVLQRLPFFLLLQNFSEMFLIFSCWFTLEKYLYDVGVVRFASLCSLSTGSYTFYVGTPFFFIGTRDWKTPKRYRKDAQRVEVCFTMPQFLQNMYYIF